MITGVKKQSVLEYLSKSSNATFAKEIGVSEDRIPKIQDYVTKIGIDCYDTLDLYKRAMAIAETESERLLALFFAGMINVLNVSPSTALKIEEQRDNLGDLSQTV